MRAFLALSKNLLSWIHRDDVPLAGVDRETLQSMVARTYSDVDRVAGRVARDQVCEQRHRYIAKPTQYGGSHGVMVGADVDADTWSRQIDDIWSDQGWALQDYWEPICTGEDKQRLSVGVHVYQGKLGAVLFRTAPGRVINARDSGLVVGVPKPS